MVPSRGSHPGVLCRESSRWAPTKVSPGFLSQGSNPAGHMKGCPFRGSPSGESLEPSPPRGPLKRVPTGSPTGVPSRGFPTRESLQRVPVRGSAQGTWQVVPEAFPPRSHPKRITTRGNHQGVHYLGFPPWGLIQGLPIRGVHYGSPGCSYRRPT